MNIPDNFNEGCLVYVGPGDDRVLAEVQALVPADKVLVYCMISGTGRIEETAANIRNKTHLYTLERGIGPLIELLGQILAPLSLRTVRLVRYDDSGESERSVEIVAQAIKHAVTNSSMENTRGLIFLRASLLNLPGMVSEAVVRLPVVSPGSAALVIGAGPSLRNQLEEIRQAVGRCLLIAVGHAVPTLLENGIIPDIVVENDPRSGIDNWPDTIDTKGLQLVAATTVDPTLAERFSGIVWCNGSSPVMNVLAPGLGIPLHNMTIYRTVSTHACDVAIRLGCRTIALIGQDYCISAGNCSHSDGKKMPLAEKTLEVYASAGGVVTTTTDLDMLRQALEEYIRLVDGAFRAANPPLHFFNCTKGGARISGVPCRSLVALTEDRVAPSVTWDRISLREVDKNTISFCESCHTETAGNRNHVIQAFLLNTVRRILYQFKQAHPDYSEKDVEALHARFLEDIYGLIQADLTDVVERIHEPQRRTRRDPHFFDCFPAWNLVALDARHKALKAYLMELPLKNDVERHYQFRWKNQLLPWFAVRDEDAGTWHAPTGLWSMIEDAHDDNNEYDARVGFYSDTDLLIVIAPGNYAHIVERMIHQNLRWLIVIDPWPAALREMAHRGVFLHYMPAGAVLIGIDKSLPDWYSLFDDAWGEWCKTGEGKAHIFVPPRLRSLRCVQAIERDVCERLSLYRKE